MSRIGLGRLPRENCCRQREFFKLIIRRCNRKFCSIVYGHLAEIFIGIYPPLIDAAGGAYLQIVKHFAIDNFDLQQKIFERTGLTASAGVSFNKFLAKVPSDWRKPAGLTVITPARAKSFIFQLKIEKFYGVGAATADIFHRLNVFTGEDLYKLPLETLLSRFGKAGLFYYNIVRGIVEAEEKRSKK